MFRRRMKRRPRTNQFLNNGSDDRPVKLEPSQSDFRGLGNLPDLPSRYLIRSKVTSLIPQARLSHYH